MAWAPDYVTLEQMKVYLRDNEAQSADNVAIAAAITGASRAIDGLTHRQFGKVAVVEQRIYPAYYDWETGRWLVEMDDCQTTTGLTVAVWRDGASVGAIDSYVLEPRNAAQRGRPWEMLSVELDSTFVPASRPREVAITALWGWTSVPTAVENATYMQVNRFFSRRESPYGVAGSPSQGSEVRLLEKLDVDVAVTLNTYMRWREAQ